MAPLCRFYPGLSPVHFGRLRLSDLARLVSHMQTVREEQDLRAVQDQARAQLLQKVGARGRS